MTTPQVGDTVLCFWSNHPDEPVYGAGEIVAPHKDDYRLLVAGRSVSDQSFCLYFRPEELEVIR